MSLLTIIQGVCAELNLVQPTVVVTSSDSQVQQLWALANRAGRTLARSYPWQGLRAEFTFVTLNQQQQTNMVPADWDRWVPNTFFDRSTRREIVGPITSRQWQWLQAQPVSSKVYLAFIERQNQVLMSPNPPAGHTVAGEYLSKNWAKSAAGAGQASFLADTDLTYLDEDLIALGLIWRWKSAKGLDYAEAMEDYEREVEQAQARDGGSTALSMAPQPIDPNRLNIPDGNFGV